MPIPLPIFLRHNGRFGLFRREGLVKKTILMTRPRAVSLRWASSLAARDYSCVVDPLLRVETIPGRRPSGDFQAVIFTSTNAPEALLEQGETLVDLLSLPCFCVGPSTGAAARAFGFTDVRCGESDSGALAGLIVEQVADKTRPLLHVCGETVDGKAHEALAKAGFAVAAWTIYRAVAATDFSAETLAAFSADRIDYVPVFSPRSARLLVSLIEKNHLTRHCHRIVAIGLSPAVADVLRTLPWRRLRVAAVPREDAVLDCLGKEEDMADTPAAPEQSIPNADAPRPSAFARFKARLVWYAFGGLVLIGCGALPLVYDFVRSDRPVEQAAPAKPAALSPVAPRAALVAVEQPAEPVASEPAAVAAHETPAVAAAPVATPAPAPVPAAANMPVAPAVSLAAFAALQDEVKSLKDEIAQLRAEKNNGMMAAQNAARAWAAAALSCWEIRAAVREGKPFAAALAGLKQQISGNAEALRAADLLTPFAAGVDSVAKLRTDLQAAAAKLSPPQEQAAAPVPGWVERARTALRALIDIHPLRTDVTQPVLDALAAGDFAAAGTAYAALPDWARSQLGGWHDRFDMTRAASSAADALAAVLAAPSLPAEGAR